MTLSFLQARAALAEIKYKPDWALRLEYRGWIDMVAVCITVRNIVDARGHIHPRPGLETTLTLGPSYAYLSSFPNKEAFQCWVFKVAIRCAEEHEMGEWFMVNGERWYDPHKNAWPSTRENL